MTIKNLFFSLCFVLTGLALVSCNKDDENPIPEVADFLVTSVVFDASGMPDQVVEVVSNADYYTVEPTENWCIVTRTELRGHYKVNCTVNNSSEARSCSVVVKIGGLVKATLPVTQQGSGGGVLPPEPVE